MKELCDLKPLGAVAILHHFHHHSKPLVAEQLHDESGLLSSETLFKQL
jgi:hypothetical protein